MSDVKVRKTYRFNPDRFGSDEHSYEVVGRDGGVQLHITERGAEAYGGLEFHYAQCPSWVDSPPNHAPCWLIGGPCWHDGTSLYVEEVLLPTWKRLRGDTKAMLEEVAREYHRLSRQSREKR